MTRNALRRLVWGAAICLLLLPLVAMQFTDAVVWTAFDFAVAGFLLLCAVASYEIASGGGLWRIGLGVAIVAGVVLLFVEGAVEVF